MKSVADQVRQRQGQLTGGASNVPILSISNAFSQSEFVEYINTLSDKDLEPLYEQMPEGIPHNRLELIRVVRSSQFSQGVESLSTVLRQGGLGAVVSNELGFPYEGEGIAGYLNGVYKGEEKEREKRAKKGKDDEKDNKKTESSVDSDGDEIM